MTAGAGDGRALADPGPAAGLADDDAAPAQLGEPGCDGAGLMPRRPPAAGRTAAAGRARAPAGDAGFDLGDERRALRAAIRYCLAQTHHCTITDFYWRMFGCDERVRAACARADLRPTASVSGAGANAAATTARRSTRSSTRASSRTSGSSRGRAAAGAPDAARARRRRRLLPRLEREPHAADARRGERPVCLTVSLIDGLVLARSAMHHSANYRSAILLGRARARRGPRREVWRGFEAIVERIVPGRWKDVRPPTEKRADLA